LTTKTLRAFDNPPNVSLVPQWHDGGSSDSKVRLKQCERKERHVMRKRIQTTKLLLAALCATGLAGMTAWGAEFKLASHERGKIESVDTAGKR
jgi:hypothetical protein